MGHTQHSCDGDVEGTQVGLAEEAVVHRRDEAGHDEDDDACVVQPPYRLQQAAVSTARGPPAAQQWSVLRDLSSLSPQQHLAWPAAEMYCMIYSLTDLGCTAHLAPACSTSQHPTRQPWRLADDRVTLVCSQDAWPVAAVGQRTGAEDGRAGKEGGCGVQFGAQQLRTMH